MRQCCGRGLLRGVIRYQREHEPWSLCFQPLGLRELPSRWLQNWQGDGISVDVGVERAGYQAAALLDRTMAGGKVPQKRLFLPPIGVVVRQCLPTAPRTKTLASVAAAARRSHPDLLASAAFAK